MSDYKTDALYMDIVQRFAKESKCCKIKVASIAVRDKSPLVVGINGTAPGKENCDQHFRTLYSKDLVKWIKESKITSIEEIEEASNMYFYGKFKSPEFLEEHHKWALINELHAEQNLANRCMRYGISLEGATIYQSYFTCPECARLLSRSGIERLVYLYDYDKQNEESREILRSQGILIEKFNYK